MKFINLTLAAAALAAGALASEAAFAGGHGHSHARVGVVVGVGAPLWGPWWSAPFYGPPPFYSPPWPSAAVSEPTWIEREDEAAPAQSAYWYYCADAKGYYPYVKECPGGWQRVAPQSPAQ